MNPTESKTISFRIEWLDSVDGEACSTLASIVLDIDGTPAWPITGEEPEEFELYADELLAHLVECWKPLILRQTYPIAIQPVRPSFLIAEATKRWASQSSAVVETEQREIEAFMDVHNLANAFGGVSGLLPLWFLRDEDGMVIDTQDRLWRVPLEFALDALVAAGDEVATRLAVADQKWAKLVAAWHQRDKGDETLLLALTIGRDRQVASELLQQNILEAPQSVSAAANDNDELRIAARMAGPLPLHQIKKVIQTIKSCDHYESPKLKATSASALELLRSDVLRDVRPHVQGEELARWLRRHLNLTSSRLVDPFDVLKRQGVDVRIIDFGFSTLRAIAVWGAKFGPAVLLHSDQSKIQSLFSSIWQNGAVRVNAAHELCHLLVDAGHGFSAVDVLGGRMPPRIEQRAKAFAAEFLLPNQEAGEAWRAAGGPVEIDGLRDVVKRLCSTFRVTISVATWQIEHGVTPYHREELSQLLDEIAPQR